MVNTLTKWRVEKHAGGGATLHVTRKCGHNTPLYYGSSEAANADAANMANTDCQPCHNSAQIETAKYLGGNHGTSSN